MVVLPAQAALSVSSAEQLTEVEVVRRVKAVYAKHCCFQAAFNQLTVNVAMDMKDNFKGTIYVRRPGSIALDVRFPEKQELVINGRSYTVYFPSDGTAVTGEVPPEVNVEHFFGFFADIGNLDKNFVASYPARTFDEGGNLVFLQLTDRKNPRTTYRVVLGIDRKNFIIRRAIISDALGNYNRFDLSETTFLDSLPDSRFAIRGAKGKGLSLPLNTPATKSDR